MADIGRARQEAADLIRQFEVSATPVPVERIARRLEIQVRYAPFDGDLSGMAYISEGISIIGVNSLHAPTRQRFTLAHELAHHRLHRHELEHAVHLDRGSLRRDWLSTQGVDDNEVEANAFASELLMPTDLLKHAIDGRHLDIEDEDEIGVLARRFRVSPAAMRFRLLRATSG